jgi:hypothetical protein
MRKGRSDLSSLRKPGIESIQVQQKRNHHSPDGNPLFSLSRERAYWLRGMREFKYHKIAKKAIDSKTYTIGLDLL